MKVLEYGGVFTAGGLGYGGLELLWRGRTHWSMLLCGGVCAVLIYLIAGRERTVLWRRWTLCAAAVTTVEYFTGVLVNLRLGWNVWNYADRPLNVLGQICPLYTLFWFGLAIPGVWLGRTVRQKLAAGRLSRWCPAVPALAAVRASRAVQPLPAAAARPLPRQPAAPAPWRSSRCGWCRAGPRRGG